MRKGKCQKNKKAQAGLVILIILLIIGGVYYFLSNSEVGSVVCGTHTEYYTESTKGCDGISNCVCLHKGFLGLGACDSCQCSREVSNC